MTLSALAHINCFGQLTLDAYRNYIANQIQQMPSIVNYSIHPVRMYVPFEQHNTDLWIISLLPDQELNAIVQKVITQKPEFISKESLPAITSVAQLKSKLKEWSNILSGNEKSLFETVYLAPYVALVSDPTAKQLLTNELLSNESQLKSAEFLKYGPYDAPGYFQPKPTQQDLDIALSLITPTRAITLPNRKPIRPS